MGGDRPRFFERRARVDWQREPVLGGRATGRCNHCRMNEDWRQVNLANWESRVPVHTGPDGYDISSFDDPTHLSNVVRYDMPRLGRLDELDVVHLQCHIGTDTVSLARLGARTVRGLDFSPAAVSAARGRADVAHLITAAHSALVGVTRAVNAPQTRRHARAVILLIGLPFMSHVHIYVLGRAILYM